MGHKAFTGSSGSGKTHRLKELIRSEKDDFKIIFDSFGEYQSDIQELITDGYTIAEESFLQPSNTPFKEQLERALNVKIENYKVLHIVTNDLNNGFEAASLKFFFHKIEQEMQDPGKKIRIYIDSNISVLNNLTKGIMAVGRSYDCVIRAAFQTHKEIDEFILNNIETEVRSASGKVLVYNKNEEPPFKEEYHGTYK
ncbi:hypothetical protein ABC970_22060 [Bacillus licheniformis]|uniref:hypothetical protein n=1 Tax=Bacillus TaxID=1386 RepID=UPI00046EEE33|nr:MULTISPECIES: hypothetical protein [Bacillus]ASK26313.1 hypothetical protein BSSX_p0122 [Bacillus subtilis]MCQ5304494.1 hypothetical protein [Bacillus licheniformis]MDM5287349.1 hypothetical protein [Bacillus licheniformis]MDN5389951.1 hypothetical protein [Bacillus sp. LB7]MEC0776986.1 hypothetical protein [Bacillus licheniformis]